MDRNDRVKETIDVARNIAASKPKSEALPWPAWGALVWQRTPRVGPDEKPTIRYMVNVILRRNEDSPFATLLNDSLIGDSEITLEDSQSREFQLPAQAPVGASHILLLENNAGRLASLLVGIEDCPSDLIAFRVAQTVFNSIAVRVGVAYKCPLHWASAIIIGEAADGSRTQCSVVSTVGYPNITGNLGKPAPKALARLYSKYAEGLRSNSPFYSFLCFFTLAEFLTQGFHGRLRRCADEHSVQYENPKGRLTTGEVDRVAPGYGNKTYDQVIEETRDMRDAIAHFFIEPSTTPLNAARPFNPAYEDAAMFARDALKVICSNLLTITERNYERLLQAGLAEDELFKVFEGES